MIDGAFLWLAISAGAFALVTPCVFPMVPVTASYFAGRGGGSRRTAFMGALLFGVGIVATFTAAGIVVSAVAGASGMARFAASPWVNLAIAAMFVAFALNFFGLYQIRVPAGVLGRLDRSHRGDRGTGLGTLLMGSVFALTTFTCTAPFVGTLLVLASQGQWQRPVAGLLAFSTTFAVPFVLLALAPRALKRLPSSGGWLQSVKMVLGLVEIGAALKFVSNADLVLEWGVFTRQVVLVSWSALSLAIAAVVLGRGWLRWMGPGAARTSARPAPVRLGFAAGFAALAVWLVVGLDGRPLGEVESFLPPRAEDTPAGVLAMAERGEEREGLDWRLNDLPGALALAREEGRRVFIDFTGYTCTNCRWMESNMFTIPEVEEQLERFVLVRLFTDGGDDIHEDQMAYQRNEFGTIALPLYAVVDAEGEAVDTFLGLTRDRREFVEFLKGAL